MDFYPIKRSEIDSESENIQFGLPDMAPYIRSDLEFIYPLPVDYKFAQLPKINRFVEIWGTSQSRETDITSFIAERENNFLLTMKFGGIALHSEVLCEWQSENRHSIKPDFFVVQPNGYADIVEFKLPVIAARSVVGQKNRESFASWLQSYIAQTRVYSTYFDDPNNRSWVEKNMVLR